MTGLRILAALTLFCLAFTSGAETRQRHKTYAAHPDCNITMPCEGVAPSVRVVRAMGGFGAASRWCGCWPDGKATVG
jgi:hypothetical protein